MTVKVTVTVTIHLQNLQKEHTRAKRKKTAAQFEEKTPRWIARVWGAWGDYCLDPKWRQWAFEKLHIDDKQVRVDLFASIRDRCKPLFITKQTDAFSFAWNKLHEHESEFLWANPPFSLMWEVITKIALEPCQAALCCPEWSDEPWWGTLNEIPHTKVCLPERKRIFHGIYKKDILPSPAWKTYVYLLDSRTQKPTGIHAQYAEWVTQKTQHKGWAELVQEMSKNEQSQSSQVTLPTKKRKKENVYPNTTGGTHKHRRKNSHF